MKKLIFIICLILLPCSAWATNYYISATGSGETCSSETPCALATAVAAAGNGDTIFFRSKDTWSSNGSSTILTAVAGVTYNGDTYDATSGTDRAKIEATTGFSAEIMVAINVSNVTFKGFEIDGNQIGGPDGIEVANRTNGTTISNITIDNCIVHDTGNPAATGWAYGIYIGAYGGSETDNVTLKNSEVYNSYHEGIAIYPSWTTDENIVDTVLVQNCKSHHNGTANTQSGMGIAVNNDARNVTIEYCSIYSNTATTGSGYGISIRDSVDDCTAMLNGPTNLIVRYNLIYSNLNIGIGLWSACGSTGKIITATFVGNLIYNNGTDSGDDNFDVDFHDGDNWPSGSIISFYNNTIFNNLDTPSNFSNAFNMSRGSGTLSGSPVFNLYNNIIYVVTASTSTSNHLPLYADYGSGTFNHGNNLFYRSTGSTNAHVSIGNYNSPTVYDRDGGSSDLILHWEASAKASVPSFIGGTLPTGFSGTYGTNMVPNTDYFQLTVDSPAKDAGATLASYTGSINGAGLTTPIVRPLGAAFDIGAYEYGTVAQLGGSAGQGFFLQGVTIR